MENTKCSALFPANAMPDTPHDAPMTRLLELLVEADNLYSTHGLLAQPCGPDGLAAGRWINNVRVHLAHPKVQEYLKRMKEGT